MERPSTRNGTTWNPGLTLTDAVLKLLPTPRTNDANGAGAHGHGGADLRTVARAEHWQRFERAIARWESLTRHAPPPLDEKNRLNAAFVEWMMGVPEGWAEGMSRTAAIHGLGNGVVVQVAEVVGAWALDGLKGLKVKE